MITIDPISRKLAGEVLVEIARAFSLGTIDEVRHVIDGRVNDTFVVVTRRGRYVVRCSRATRTLADVQAEHRLMEHLAAARVPVPRPLRTAHGATEHLVDGRIFRVTEFVEGVYPRDLDPDHGRQVARVLARYHQVVREVGDGAAKDGFRPVRDHLLDGLQRLPWPEPVDRPPGPDADGDELAGYLHYWLAVTHDHLANVDDALPRLTIHGSCRYESFLFQDGQIVAMLDFDNGYPDVRTLDLGIALLSFAAVRPDKDRFDLSAARAFLHGYCAVEPLSDTELALVPWYMRARILKRELVRYEHALGKPSDRRASRLRRAAARLAWLDLNERALVDTMTIPTR